MSHNSRLLQECINTQYLDLVEEGLSLPADELLRAAVQLVIYLDSQAWHVQRIIPNGEGGLVFEQWGQDATGTFSKLDRLDLSQDTTVEYTKFLNSKFLSRQVFSLQEFTAGSRV